MIVFLFWSGTLSIEANKRVVNERDRSIYVSNIYFDTKHKVRPEFGYVCSLLLNVILVSLRMTCKKEGPFNKIQSRAL